MARRRGASHRAFGSRTDRRMKLVAGKISCGLSPPAIEPIAKVRVGGARTHRPDTSAEGGRAM